MRYALAFVLAGLLAVGFVLHERRSELEHRLGAVASQLAERPVKVHCQGVTGELVDVTPEAGMVRFDAEGRPSDTTDLKRWVCSALDRFRSDVATSRFDCVLANQSCDRRTLEDALAVHTLAHEVWHLRGEGSEAITECKALQTTAEAAMLFGADQRHADAIALYMLTQIYPQEPDEYRTAQCVNGGPFDLRPADPHWP